MAPNVGLGTDGPIQRGWGLWLTSVLAVVIAAVFVSARLLQRLVKRSGFGMDDYMIIAALVSSGLLSLTECQAVVYGYGRHWNVLQPATRMTARKWFYGANIVYKVVLTFNKISIACLYYRIFAVSSNSFRIACNVMNAWIVASSLAFITATIFQCTPIAAFWDRSIPGFRCFKNEPWWISYASIQISTDFALLLLPIPEIMKLSMGRTEKLGVCLVFGTGAFVTFASIYRATTIAASASDPDPTWGPIPATIWSVIEANAGIVCACLPMLRGPFVRLFGPIFGRSRKEMRPSGSYHLTWRSDKPHAPTAVSSRRRGADDTIMNPERDSEEGFVIDETEASMQAKESRFIVRGRSPSGIFVRKEFSVDDSLANTASDGDRSTVASVSEDRSHSRVPHSHI